MNIVVTGFIRSGTSMMMRMLEAGGLDVVANEAARPRDANNPHGFYETIVFLELTSWGLANLDSIDGRPVKVIATALDRWPPGRPAKVIYMERDTWERLHSMSTFWRTHREGFGLRDCPPLPTKGPALVDGYMARQRATILAMPQFDILRVQYADVRTDPRAVAERVSNHLGLALDVEAMAGVYSERLYRNRV